MSKNLENKNFVKQMIQFKMGVCTFRGAKQVMNSFRFSILFPRFFKVTEVFD